MTLLCTIIALGDAQEGATPFSEVVSSIISNEDSSSIVLYTGDFYDENFDTYSKLEQLKRLQNSFSNFIITRGNHDPIDIFNENFQELPNITDVCENVSIIAIDSNRHYSRQIAFVKEHIEERPNRTFVILMHHHLMPCSTANVSETFWRAALENVLRENDLVIHGHDHIYSSYSLENGTLVLGASLAGKKRYRCIAENRIECNCSIPVHHSEREYIRIKLENDIWSHERITVY